MVTCVLRELAKSECHHEGGPSALESCSLCCHISQNVRHVRASIVGRLVSQDHAKRGAKEKLRGESHRNQHHGPTKRHVCAEHETVCNSALPRQSLDNPEGNESLRSTCPSARHRCTPAQTSNGCQASNSGKSHNPGLALPAWNLPCA